MAGHYGLDGKLIQKYYKENLSDFREWDLLSHAEDYILFPKNISYHLCIDETALTSGELYTILSSKKGHGRKGTIVAVIKGTKAEDIINVLCKIPEKERNIVKEVTLDMAGSMQKIIQCCFPKAIQVIDSFHVQNLRPQSYDKNVARLKLAQWYESIEKEGYRNFSTVSQTIKNNYERILNFFINRSTNAAAESFNAKLKFFRASFRGVADMTFFLFRISKIYA
ncbi:transposase [uncultured Bacteroides sp.]|uniref:transposase n=1 Tax=uncultured Bacteroides sp. TaxID=162156 RepID=UPI002AAB797D|nr:transposase [uncultured Bacteroides sp.]